MQMFPLEKDSSAPHRLLDVRVTSQTGQQWATSVGRREGGFQVAGEHPEGVRVLWCSDFATRGQFLCVEESARFGSGSRRRQCVLSRVRASIPVRRMCKKVPRMIERATGTGEKAPVQRRE